MAAKRKLSTLSPEAEEIVDPADELMFLCLGGGNEVGRSCHIIQYKGKTVMLDAGRHPAFQGLAALPYFDEFDLSTVDILLISHFHVDHAASLPYVLAKTNFKGRVFMTHATKAIYKYIIMDGVRISNASSSSDSQTELYTEADHMSTYPKIEAIDYYTTHTISSIHVTPYPAGHVLGAAMFLIEIAGLKILFTGDYSREEDRHLISAQVPKTKIDVLIVESTFGIASSVPRTEKETAMMKSITGILNRGGRVLMPVFALGRAQELLLILDEYWSKHPELQKIPIYYASNLARKCMAVYQTYVGSMNDNIKRLFKERMAEAEQAGGDVSRSGPWDFQYIRSLRNLDRFDDVGSCVMLASPGMFQYGVSRELLERWAPNDKNGVILTGYSVEGTMGKQILHEPESIPAIMGSTGGGFGRKGLNRGEGDKPMIPRRCSVQEFSFAAHVDGQENQEFIKEIGAPVVILVHGEKHNMMRLKSKLLSLNADKENKTRIFSPANTEELRIPFKTEKSAKVVGRLAEIPPPKGEETDDNRLIAGVLVQNDFKMSLMAAEDLREYAGLTTTTIICKQRLTLHSAGIGLIKWALAGTFGAIEEISSSHGSKQNGLTNGHDTDGDHEMGNTESVDRAERATFVVMGCIKVHYENRGEITVEWEGNILNDGIADSVMAVLYTVESSPAAVMESSKHCQHGHSHKNPHADITPEERFSRLCMFLETQFGPSLRPINRPKLPLKLLKPLQAALRDPAIKDEPDDDDDDGIDDETREHIEEEELARLHGVGIPVPGVEITVDRNVAKVWLETLEVECSNALLRDRVKAVVERAVETIAPLSGSRR